MKITKFLLFSFLIPGLLSCGQKEKDESGGRVPGFGPKPEERFVWPGLDGKDFNNDYGNTSSDWGAYPEADSLV